MGSLLKIVDLEKRFELQILNKKTIAALHQVSLEVGEGEILALTGKSGSGKSTIMKRVYRTYLASGGEIRYRRSQAGWAWGREPESLFQSGSDWGVCCP
jgi:alpha-D-ribose 1-methylphosphonate 5-triphosphate synthase subunit PhnL